MLRGVEKPKGNAPNQLRMHRLTRAQPIIASLTCETLAERWRTFLGRRREKTMPRGSVDLDFAWCAKKPISCLHSVTDEDGQPLENEDEPGGRLREYRGINFQMRAEGPRHQQYQNFFRCYQKATLVCRRSTQIEPEDDPPVSGSRYAPLSSDSDDSQSVWLWRSLSRPSLAKRTAGQNLVWPSELWANQVFGLCTRCAPNCGIFCPSRGPGPPRSPRSHPGHPNPSSDRETTLRQTALRRTAQNFAFLFSFSRHIICAHFRAPALQTPKLHEKTPQ